MDAGLVSAASAAVASNPAPLLMLRKALDIQEQTVMSLLDALPAPAGSVNPPNLGQNVDTFA
ncbi:YjfB family protein [Chitinilyticum piscinae]|uniref:YjfB family protein n=1 Tax=Chitinilyticum piscinae TaxID=2866724 RepID=A0A8J7K1T5_9NEIS|nr:YjfB family protein [Chitinilyticum piscinae]MBE9609671.1 YjfB family protein [Chitinilyticum piscinae]